MASVQVQRLSDRLHTVVAAIRPVEVRRRGRPPVNRPAPTTTRFELACELVENKAGVERERSLPRVFRPFVQRAYRGSWCDGCSGIAQDLQRTIRCRKRLRLSQGPARRQRSFLEDSLAHRRTRHGIDHCPHDLAPHGENHAGLRGEFKNQTSWVGQQNHRQTDYIHDDHRDDWHHGRGDRDYAAPWVVLKKAKLPRVLFIRSMLQIRFTPSRSHGSTRLNLEHSIPQHSSVQSPPARAARRPSSRSWLSAPNPLIDPLSAWTPDSTLLDFNVRRIPA